KQLLDEAQSKMEAHLFVRDNLRKAQDYFNNRDYPKCLSECQKILLLDSNNSAVHTLMTKAQEKMEAEPFVQNFITSGQSLFDSGLYSEAISQWEKVRSIDPVYPGLDGLIQSAREKLGENEELMDTVATNSMPSLDLNLDINTEQGPDGFSFDAFGIEKPEQKTENLEFQSDEDRIKYLLREGDELSGSGHYQRAIEVWSEIFMLDVNHPEALQKIEVARQAAAQQRQASQEIVKKAIAAYESGDIEEARDLFQQVQASDPDNSEASRYLEMLPSPTGAPTSLNDLIAQAKQAEEQGQYREAAMLYSQALAIDADNADLADRVKNLNLMAKRQEQGRTVLGNARAFLAEGKLESARHAVTKILESDPSNPEALEIMKEIKAHAGAAALAEPRVAPAGTGVTRHAKKSLPLMPLMFVGGALVLLGSGFVLWNSLGSKSDKEVAQVRPIKKPIKKPTTKQATPVLSKPAVIVSPQDKQKAGEMVQEAQFYFMEKRYDEALQKAEDALKLDPENKDATGVRDESSRLIKEALAAEQKVLDDANAYFSYSEFAGAVRLYEKYLQRHPETVQHIQPQIIKCYYNLGVIAIRQWRCDTAADYFRQVLFIDDTDKLSKDALALSRKCQQMGTSDLDVRKAVAFMEMRK
ncbi:MAG TPA: tetratricopeptide repeat protein, partial [Acidobacteriota bacterium]|nr:tetratricopeptide repeat protein [Acidobacteriota bacterium]